ncbi:MAG: mechanosensitive ion channel family protein [Verrucomicrobiaceae bacterium]|nr:mechanosensitive ion channel family protein [Verrucomicrobiaceae bacterium]
MPEIPDSSYQNPAAGKPSEEAATDAPSPLEALQKTSEAVNERVTGLADSLTTWIDAQPWIPDGLVRPVHFVLLLLAVAFASWLLFKVARPLVLRVGKRIAEKSPTRADEFLFGHGVFRWLTHVLPALLIYTVTPGFFASVPWLARILKTGSLLYLLLAAYMVVDSLVNAITTDLQRTRLAQRMNLGALAQVIKLVTALVVFILAIALVIGKSPMVLLGGLSVFASVLMLVFKDVILGFVAGIQLSTNRLLSPGDWLEMPSHYADGDVMEIGLTTVKVRNWDKTITTIPTYALISEPFKNWRGMIESGGRRIKRSLTIDTNSIRLCDADMLARFHRIEHLADYLREREKEIAEWNEAHGIREDSPKINGRRLTNIGTFRAYVSAYLRTHPGIHQDMTLLVRQLAPEGRGLPIEIYCFSADRAWANYETIQADIFDHLYAVIPEFGLRVFQEPTGLDFRRLADSPDPADGEADSTTRPAPTERPDGSSDSAGPER